MWEKRLMGNKTTLRHIAEGISFKLLRTVPCQRCQLWYSWYSVIRDRCCYSIFILLITAWMGVCVLTSTGLRTGPVSQQPPYSPRDQSPIPSSPQNPMAVWFLDPGWLSASSFHLFFLFFPSSLTFSLCSTVQCQLWQRDKDALCELPR